MPFALSRSARAALCGAVGVALLLSVPVAKPDTPLFDYRSKTLSNGLQVLTLEDRSCPIVAVQLWYHVGSKDEDPERQGFAHMFEHMMFRGTDRLGPTDHFDFIRRTGGDCNAYTSFDNTTYVQTLPSNQLELALWLEAERMAFLKIDQTSFDTERKVVEEERRLGLNRPYGTAPEKALAEMFQVHPYRWLPIGRIPHLRAASVQELRDFWTRYYVPNNATLVVVGDIEHARVQQLAEQYFGWIPRYPDPPRVTVREPDLTAPKIVKIKEDNAPAPVGAVAFRAVPVGHDDYIPLQMLATILGGGESSRMYRDLVADQQLAVAAIAAAFPLEQDGLFVAGAVLSPMGGKLEKAVAAIESHLERVRTEPVTEAELHKVRNQMLKSTVQGTLTIESKAQQLGSAAVIEGDPARLNTELERVRAVTPEVLLRVARQYLDPQKSYTLTIEGNLLGSLFAKKKGEDDAPITATPETEPPPPGRAGLERPAAYPRTAPIGAALDFKPAYAKSEKTLPNGLKVMVVPNKEVPFISASLNLHAGAWAEQRTGVASLALQMLTKGTEKHDDAALATELETYAIDLGGGASIDDARVSAGCLPEHVDRALTLLAEVVRTPTFPEDEFEKLRKQVRTGLAVSQAEPSYVADRELRRVLFGSHPYARTAIGETSDVDAVVVDDLKSWWRQFARPDMAVLIFAGDIDEKRAVELAQAHFGDWAAEGPRPQVDLPVPPPPSETKIYLVDRAGVQSQIRVGQLGITRQDPRYAISRVVSGYFGEAFNARLNETIRVKKGLTYGARGAYSAQRFGGRFVASTFSKTDSTVEALQAIFDELKRLKDEAPSEKELNDTKSYIVGSFPGDRETPTQVAGELWMLESNRLPVDYYERLLRNVAATTADECIDLVTSTLDPAHMAVVVVGSANKLKDELAKIAPVEVIKPPATTQPSDETAASGDEQ